jgi:hypothetical protein
MTAAVDIITIRIEMSAGAHRAVRRGGRKQDVYQLIGGENVPSKCEIGAYEET